MTGSDKIEKGEAGRGPDMAALEDQKQIPLDDVSRARLEGAFVSPCGTEGCRWEGFPEWPEEFPYDAFGDGWDETGKKENKK